MDTDGVFPKFRYVTHEPVYNATFFTYEIESLNFGDGIAYNNGEKLHAILNNHNPYVHV